MKEGWDYKKLGDVATIINGKNQKAVEDDNGVYPICGSGGIMGYANEYLCPEQTVIIGRKGNINRPIYMEQKFWNVDTAFGIVANKLQLHPKFLFYFCVDFNFERLNKAVTIPSLVKSDLLKIDISIPPLSEQQHIVEELDLLSSIIEKKKTQLNELDNLAQSLFYEMFGDPITNEKRWEVIRLGDKCSVSSFKRVLIEDVVDKGIPFIRGTELMALANGDDVDFTLFITPEHYEVVKEISDIPKIGDLLIPSINAKGCIWIVNTDQPRYYKDGRVLWVHVDADSYTSETLKFIMSLLIKETYSAVASGATFAELKLFVLRDLQTILPPLFLQQQFASKIEAIEHQKDLIKQSIKEVETLFNSRMDFYFN
jgi:type I restriction enzyme S subunit